MELLHYSVVIQKRVHPVFRPVLSCTNAVDNLKLTIASSGSLDFSRICRSPKILRQFFDIKRQFVTTVGVKVIPYTNTMYSDLGHEICAVGAFTLSCYQSRALSRLHTKLMSLLSIVLCI